jgi:hypothetical protein
MEGNARLARLATPHDANLQARHFRTATSRLQSQSQRAPTGGTGTWHLALGHCIATHRNATLPYPTHLHIYTPDSIAPSAAKRTNWPHTCQIGTLKNSRISQPSHVPEWSFRLVEAWNPPNTSGESHRGLELGPKSRNGALAVHPRLQALFESNLQLLYLRSPVQVYNSGSSAPGLNYRAEALEGRQPLPEDDTCTAEAFLVGLQNPKPKIRGQE